MSSVLDLSLVIDIGKSNAKLLLLDAAGHVVESHGRANASVQSTLGYPALDVIGLQQWMQETLQGSANAKRCGHVIASTHGASLVALGEDGLAWEPLDYEFDVRMDGTAAAQAFKNASGSFQETLSPDLPAGLNAARQLYWLQNMQPEAWRKTRTLLPYPQYWAWLLSGVAASEVSSLGCHTHVWNPNTDSYSSLAVHQGWASLFAPLRKAWEVLGTVGAERAAAWGLPAACQVHVGVHDSNACLARYIAAPGAASAATDAAQALTIVSSGTWTVLMAPGASAAALHAGQDMLANVDVTGRLTPTARFMGGREFEALLDGARADAASLADVQALIDTGCYAIPAFATQGGPFAGHVGHVQYQGQRSAITALGAVLSEAQRAALAALYCAQMTTWLLQHLWQDTGANTTATHRVIVEGPLSHNPHYLSALQALMPAAQVAASVDAVEGTAKGAWRLAQGFGAQAQAQLQVQDMSSLTGMGPYHKAWLKQLPAMKF